MGKIAQEPDERMLTVGDVAKMYNVDPKTVTRWAHQDDGTGRPRLPSIKTPGGHHRFRESDILRAMKAELDEDIITISVLHPRTKEVIHEQLCAARLGQTLEFDASFVMVDSNGTHIVKMPVRVSRT